MKKVILTSLACASLMLAASNDYKYEITPMVGGAVTEGNTDLEEHFANAGLAIGFNQKDLFFDQFELGFLQSIGDVNYENANRSTSITRLFANIVKFYPINSDLSLYALAGLGYEHFDDEFAGNDSGGFGNYGAGVKLAFSDDIALKFDLRHIIEADHGDNTLLYNFGVAIPFGKIAKAPVVVPMKKAAPIMPPKDSDNDGVIDAKDDYPDTMSGAQVDKVGCITLVNLNINFDTDSSTIKDSYTSKIIEFAKVMKSNTKLRATIEAHTDSVASHAYNQKLSERRAASTVKALKDLDVDPSRLKSVGYGETRPIATNDTVEGKAQNRRVHAVIDK